MALRLRRIFLISLIGGFFLTILACTFSLYLANYRATDGIVLPNGETVGSDFVCFYAAGKMVRENRATLYDYELQTSRQKEILGSKGYTKFYPFIYPPLFALLFVPLSYLSLLHAYYVWLFISACLLVLSFFLVLNTLKRTKREFIVSIIAAFSFVPFSVNCLGAGQTSCIGLFVSSVIFVFLKREKSFWAGVALGFSYYKPPIFVVFLLLTLMERNVKLLFGFITISVILLSGTILMIGWEGAALYLKLALNNTYGSEILPGKSLPLDKAVSLLPFLHRLIPQHLEIAKLTFWCLMFVFIGAFLFTVRRIPYDVKQQMFGTIFSLKISLSLLLSIYFLVYDLTIILLPLLIVWSTWSECKWRITNLLFYISTVGLFVEFLFRSVSINGSVIQSPTIFMFLWVVALFLKLSGEHRTP